MSEREKIEERLRKKEQEIQSLEDKLRTARIYVQALQDVLKLLGHDEPSAPAESVLKPGSSVARAREMILENGRPMHINDILDALGLEPSREKRASLTSSLAAYVRRTEIFTRPAPNTFGLIELGHHSVDQNQNEPPSSFGEIRPATSQPTPSDDDEIPF